MIFTPTDERKRVPKVFISSTVKGVKPEDSGLEPYREKLYKLVTEKFKWECTCSGISDQYFWGPALAACLKAVEDSNFYIGIFWKRHGFIVIPQEMSITELEFYRAINLRKPMRIYIIHDDNREILLQLSLDFIMSDPEIAPYVCFCNLSELEEKVKIDLEEFGNAWDSEEGIDRFVPPYYIDESLKMLDLLPSELLFLEEPPIAKHLFDKDFVLKKLQDMESNYSKYKFEDVLRDGWDVLNMLRFKPPGKYKEYRTLWAKFLGLWSGACNWSGHIEGSLGSVWASKSLLEIYRLLEAWSLFGSSAGGLSSTLYTLTGIKDAKSLVVGDVWQEVLKKQRVQLLKEALRCCNYALIKSGRVQGGLLSIRGSIHRELGNYKSAVADFRCAIDIGGSEESHASHLSNLGLSQILDGDRQKGMRNLERNKEICDRVKSPWTVRIRKRFGEGLIVTQNWDEAKEEIKKAIQLGKQLKLGHQVITAVADLHRIEKKKKE